MYTAKGTFTIVLLTGLFAFPVLGSDEPEAEKALPREISGLELGQKFDTEGESVHSFSNNDGTTSYVFHDAKNDLSINVEIDDQSRITRLSWHFLVHAADAREKAHQDLQNKFGVFFKHREKIDDGEKLSFQDATTSYTVAFEGHMITIVTQDTGAKTADR